MSREEDAVELVRSTHPLPALVASVSRDERLAQLVDPGVGVSLESVIDSRRCSLVLDDRPSWLTPYAHSKKPDGVIQLFGPFGGIRFPTVVEGPVLAYYEPESDYNIGGYVSPYYGGDAQEWAIRLGPFLESCGLAGGFSRLQITVGGQPPWLQDRRVVTQDGISTNGELRSGAA